MNTNNANRRTFQQVHRDSFVLGAVEAEVFRPYTQDEMALSLEAAERFERHAKVKGRRNGPLGHVGLEVYRALWRHANFRSGRCDPSIEGLMSDTRRSRRAVVAALKRLWNCGLVRWIRRFVYTGERATRGPQVQQATNAYELRTLPEALLGLLPAAKRNRYRPQVRPAPAPSAAPRQRGSKPPMFRVSAAWERMGQRISRALTAPRQPGLDALAERLKALDDRESTEGNQNPPSEIFSSS